MTSRGAAPLPAPGVWATAEASLYSTLISVGTAIVVLGVGPLVDRLGRRKGMIITVSGTALASAVSAATMNAAYLVGVRSIGGLGLAEQSVNATYLNEIYAVTEDEKIKKRRGLVYSLVQGGWPLGTLLAAAFIAIFLPLVGWRGCFLLATFPAVVIALLRRGLRETPQFRCSCSS
ncbi:MFS transporter [Nonomuraea sp. NPDC050691]|uniref:MFS transporter n=1 Tax=Nonomuraea sp. NPDC050691 TaxID=3155661 RepID=UPI0033D026CE